MEIKIVKAKAVDVAAAIDNISTAMAGESDETLMLACIGTAVLIQNPDISPEKFLAVIKDTSEYIALQVAMTPSEVH